MRRQQLARAISLWLPASFMAGIIVASLLVTSVPALFNEQGMERNLAFSGDRVVFTSYFYWYRSKGSLQQSTHVIDQIFSPRVREILAFTPADFPPGWEGSTDPTRIVRNVSGTYYVDALGHHPPAAAPSYNSTGDVAGSLANGTMENLTNWLSWLNPAWHEWEMRCMIRAGINVLLPVFWGNGLDPNDFSVTGLGPLVSARTTLAQNVTDEANARTPGLGYTVENYGDRVVPKIAMFFDTTCMKQLWCANKSNGNGTLFNWYFKNGSGADLKDPYWQDQFWHCIERFYDRVNGTAMFQWHGYCVCWLYEALWFSDVGGPGSGSVLDYCKALFQARYGKNLLFVGPHRWMKAGIDAVCDWGACCQDTDPIIVPWNHGISCGAVSPGFYNMGTISQMGSRPTYKFRNITTYKHAWQELIDANTAWVHVETWNEWHEGTDISWNQEHGYAWIDVTREMVDKFHANNGHLLSVFENLNIPAFFGGIAMFGAIIILGGYILHRTKVKRNN